MNIAKCMLNIDVTPFHFICISFHVTTVKVIGVVHCENKHILRHRSVHTGASAIYYQVDSVTEALHCKTKGTINLKPDPTTLNAGDLILLANPQHPWTLLCAPENKPFSLEYSAYRDINRTKSCECPFLVGSYYLAKAMPTCQGNTATIVIPLACIMCLTRFFDSLKAYHQI